MTSRLGLFLSIAQAEPWLLGKPLDLPFQVFIKRWAIPGLYFLIFVLSIVRLVDKILPMSGFKPQIPGAGSNHSTNWAFASWSHHTGSLLRTRYGCYLTRPGPPGQGYCCLGSSGSSADRKWSPRCCVRRSCCPWRWSSERRSWPAGCSQPRCTRSTRSSRWADQPASARRWSGPGRGQRLESIRSRGNLANWNQMMYRIGWGSV